MVVFAALVFAAAGPVAVLALGAAVEVQMDHRFDRIARDMAGNIRSQPDMAAAVTALAARTPVHLRWIALTAGDGRLVAGNLGQWPDSLPRLAGNVTVAAELGPVRAAVIGMADGGFLLIATPMPERVFLTALEGEVALATSAIMLLAGVAAGVLIARRALHRLDRVNRTAATILAGDLSRRVPRDGGDDEYDQLADNLNAMLDRIQGLVGTVRGITHNIAHDLRSPLNRLRGRLEVALMTERSPAEYQQALAAAMDQADSIVATFNALLTIARIEGGVANLDRRAVDVTEAVESLGDLYQPLAEESGLDLRIEVDPGLLIAGDPHLVSQALNNLLDNAIKYTPAGGFVRLSAHLTPQGICVSVRDSGPGIAADQRGKVLEHFVRLDPARHLPGAGLGLSLVAAVVQTHGAVLSLQDGASQDGGPGLLISLTFPPLTSS
ncbi:sensor histidine kinase [Magnetospirillum sulfuroxidans]|uniref:histidine kinase n=1 Tax=Magnetospirillum sulfuroxidans TaxID=611300 RepID=A0ABS5I6W6_9PROT|nr:HAMP domain-containing sensor histidine kinase [Magnetospirillum sulfuroxidans]MBR9970162.1 HAMP domain-containing protein [Magnetospirillum sulfuroxidans]